MKTKAEWQPDIDACLDNFDFEKTRNGMVGMKWEWSGSLDEFKIPTIAEMRNCARRLLDGAATIESGYLSTGGFVAKREGEYLSLAFIVDEVCSQPE